MDLLELSLFLTYSILTDRSNSSLSLQVLRCLVKIYQTLPNPDYLSICQCLMFLGEPETVASILDKLLSGSKVHFCSLFAFAVAYMRYHAHSPG
jgi:hypothetical protein